MSDYKVIGVDLAKKNFAIAAINESNKVLFKKSISRKDFFNIEINKLNPGQTFAFEACGGAHYTAQKLKAAGHKVIVLKAKDVKPYAKARQKNDKNDAIAIAKAACDPDLMHVEPKTPEQQTISYLHKARQNVIQQRIQRSNSLITSLFEFGYLVQCGKTKFAKDCKNYIEEALDSGFIGIAIYDEMMIDCEEIAGLLKRESKLDKEIIARNKESEDAMRLITIPGIGPINASILSNKTVSSYETPKDFAASLGLVPRQNTTGGNISLGGITKQGDRYARTMLIQAGRSLVMRCYKGNVPNEELYDLISRLKAKKKAFNVIAVAVANKLARIAYACLTNKTEYAV